MKYTCIIERRGGTVLSWLLDEKGHAAEIHADPDAGEGGGQIRNGQIWAGRVQRVRPDLQAAFVDLCPGHTGYLPLKDAEGAVFIRKGASPRLQQGDELLVQVAREPLKTKDAGLTAVLSLQGTYSVVSWQEGTAGISKRLPSAERERLRELAAGLRAGESFGLILRTNAADAPEDKVEEEVRALRAALSDIVQKGRHRVAGSLVYGPASPWLQRLLSLGTETTEKIVADGEDLYERAREFLGAGEGSGGTGDAEKTAHPLLDRLRLYSDPMISCRALYSLDRELREALDEKVWLPGGGFLIIQPTEALTVIDVNSGKAVSKKNKEEALLKVNLEAAAQICRQLRLRDISGIIIVDFINQDTRESKEMILQALRAGLREDPRPASVVGLTGLGLVEMTRKKTGPALAQSLQDNKYL